MIFTKEIINGSTNYFMFLFLLSLQKFAR